MAADDPGTAHPRFLRLPIQSHLDSPPPAANVQVRFGARSWGGPRRSVNDDHFLVLRLGRHQETLLTSLPEGAVPERFDEFAYGMVIADGVGRSGEAASRLAVTTLAELAIHFGKWNVRIDEPTAEEVMDRGEAFYKDVDLVLAQAGREGGLQLEAAMTVVYTAGSELFFAHVGHSRAYLYRDRTLLQMTRDHTLAGEPRPRAATVDLGATARDLHHRLTETIGRAGTAPRIDIERLGLLDGDIVLLCTNGLTDVVDDEGIAGELRQPRTPEEHCQALIHRAIERHASDDVSVVMARYDIPE
jgi:PPM family protein phosphatase